MESISIKLDSITSFFERIQILFLEKLFHRTTLGGASESLKFVPSYYSRFKMIRTINITSIWWMMSFITNLASTYRYTIQQKNNCSRSRKKTLKKCQHCSREFPAANQLFPCQGIIGIQWVIKRTWDQKLNSVYMAYF